MFSIPIDRACDGSWLGDLCAGNPEILKVPSVLPAVGQNVALHTSHAARDST